MKASDRKTLPPWIIRTYAGFGNAEESNRRYRENLRSGQTGLSIAFDLPTQNGYNPGDDMARGEVGGCGVSIAHLGDMRTLLDGIDLATINTSMTINATAPFHLALYLVLAEQRGITWDRLRGTVQNDLMKEFVARGTSVFSPEASLRLSTDLVIFTSEHVPHWNPINVCGYHYMESGAGPAEEIGYAFGNAMILLDTIRPKLSDEAFERVVRRISFFINSGIELVPEICKVRAYSQLWRELCESEYRINDVAFRAGCQVRSLSLTAAQPENNIVRIALEALPAILSASARVNALQLPGFREALSLPDQMEQTLSLRTQQILQRETRITGYDDIFEGSKVIEHVTTETKESALEIATRMRSVGYAESIRMLGSELTKAMSERQQRIEAGVERIVGVNEFQEPVGLIDHLPDPPATARNKQFGNQRAADLQKWIEARDKTKFEVARSALALAISSKKEIMNATIEFAKTGGTVGEWSSIVEAGSGGRYSMQLDLHSVGGGDITRRTSRPVRIVLGKAGLDGHTNAIKTLAIACRNAGMEVVFAGSKLSPEKLMNAALEEDAEILGVSCLSGAHLSIAAELLENKNRIGCSSLRIVMGGTIPEQDKKALLDLGIDLVISQSTTSFKTIVNEILEIALQEQSPV